MFELSELSETAIHYLSMRALFPADWMDLNIFETFIGLDENEQNTLDEAFQECYHNGWLEFDELKGCKIHQIIKEVVLQNAPIKTDTFIGVADIIGNFIKLSHLNEWHYPASPCNFFYGFPPLSTRITIFIHNNRRPFLRIRPI